MDTEFWMPEGTGPVIVAMSGGVDSSVVAWQLKQAGYTVEGLHMTNWEDDDGYCSAAEDLQDARRVCDQLGIPLHHVNFTAEYRDRVFQYFLDEYAAGRTPNPDVLCNREIKFGVFADYARRLGGYAVATGHYARLRPGRDGVELLKGRDPGKDQSYFLHAVSAEQLATAAFPIGSLVKDDVRRLASDAGLATHRKKDSTGICFIGERPFREFLSRFLPAQPGEIVDDAGKSVGEHHGLMYYTMGQRQGLGIGGRADASDAPWYVAGKDLERNQLRVVQGKDHPDLYAGAVVCDAIHWINAAPDALDNGARLTAKIRYRQADQHCTVRRVGTGVRLDFDTPQWAVACGQYAVLYDGDHCLGGGAIDRVEAVPTHSETAATG
ncbi:MAG: tRNA 2-thiouridine(34) synthase MnmA [Pseudomonadota bacterium]